jgi:uncharacterized membrane protein YGL010W
MDTLTRIAQIDSFWAREFAYYLNEHRNPKNRATHMVGIPFLILTAIAGLAYLPTNLAIGLALIVGGQVIGWTIQVIGHRIEGNKPALLKRPISFAVGPLMVFVEMAEMLGVHFKFAKQGRDIVLGSHDHALSH